MGTCESTEEHNNTQQETDAKAAAGEEPQVLEQDCSSATMCDMGCLRSSGTCCMLGAWATQDHSLNFSLINASNRPVQSLRMSQTEEDITAQEVRCWCVSGRGLFSWVLIVC